VPASTLSKLETEEQAKAFQETLDAIERIDFSKLKSKSGSLFYSGKVGDDPAWRVAERMAKEKNMNWITDVSDGALDKHRGVIPQDAMDYLDRKLSTELAKNVSGDVEILGDPASIRKTSVFYQNELPELLKNPNISPASKEKILQLQGVLDAQFAPPGG